MSQDSVNDEEEDAIVKTILDSKELHRNHPPSIILEDIITDISFHPARNMIGVASITGDVFMYVHHV